MFPMALGGAQIDPLQAFAQMAQGGQPAQQAQVADPLVRALEYAKQQQAQMGPAPQADPSIMADMERGQRERQMAEALMGQGYVQDSGALGALAQVFSAYAGKKKDAKAGETIADALAREMEMQQQAAQYEGQRKAFDEGPRKIMERAEQARALGLEGQAAQEFVLTGKMPRGVGPTSKERDFERAQRDPAYAAWLEKNAPKGTNVTVQNPGLSLSYDEEGRPVVGYDGGLTKPSQTKVEGNVMAAEDQLASLRTVGEQVADDYLTYEGRVKGAAGRVMDKFGVGPGDGAGGEMVDFAAQRGAALQGVEEFFNQYRKEITGAAAAQQELEALKKATINGDLGPTEFRARYNALINKIEGGLQRNVRRAGGTVAPAPVGNMPAPQVSDDDLVNKYL